MLRENIVVVRKLAGGREAMVSSIARRAKVGGVRPSQEMWLFMCRLKAFNPLMSPETAPATKLR